MEKPASMYFLRTDEWASAADIDYSQPIAEEFDPYSSNDNEQKEEQQNNRTPRKLPNIWPDLRQKPKPLFKPEDEEYMADLADRFVCIADASKLVQTLGKFPLPVEIIPMAAAQLTRRFAALGGSATLRAGVVTDNGGHILDVTGLSITDPLAFEAEVSQWPGVVTVGVFVRHKAQVCLLGAADGVKTLTF